MTLSAEICELWQAMDIGPVWLVRETPDPLLPETSVRAAHAQQAPQPAASAPSAAAVPPVPRTAAPRIFHQQTAPAVPDVRETMRPAARAAAKPAAVVPPVPVHRVELDSDIRAAAATADWETLQGLVEKCRACSMGSSRLHAVFGERARETRIVLVGEAPGAEEDQTGQPFVGKSGQLLTQMLESVGLGRRENITILNVLKCRPPGNRNPAPDEVACCEVFLRRQLELLKPDLLMINGRFAMQALLGVPPTASISSQRGRVHEVTGIDGHKMKAVVSYHPSYLLRSPGEKAKAWEDLCLVRKLAREAGIKLLEKEKKWQ